MNPAPNLISKLKRLSRWTLLSVLSGILAGLSAAAFLILLDWATRTRDANSWIIWLLPLGGLAIGWLYYRYGRSAAGGTNLILDEIHDPKNTVPARMAPFILGGTIVTHLFGGSAGREGTAVQMGASLSDQLSRFFKIEPEERKILLVAGAGAGFSAAIGAPWAGTIFGMEVISIGRLRPFAWFECLVASFVGYYTAIAVGAHHSVFPPIAPLALDARALAWVALAGAIFGLGAVLFVRVTHIIERGLKKLVPSAPLRPLVSGLLLIALYKLEGTYRFVGLGIPYIRGALANPVPFTVPALKGFFTALTVGSGFKGGEFIPLVYVGTTLGSALSTAIPVPLPILSGVGFAAVFAGASNTPIACSLMAAELFGFGILPYALAACFASYWFSGHRGIYGSQRIHATKHARIRAALNPFAWKAACSTKRD